MIRLGFALFFTAASLLAAPRRYLVATTPGASLPVAGRDAICFTSVDGCSMLLTDDEARAFARRADVRWVEPEVIHPRIDEDAPLQFAMLDAPATRALEAAQTMPWGVVNVGAPALWRAGARGEGVRVAVIDSGIEATHPDLRDNYRGGWDFVDNDADPNDQLGSPVTNGWSHGTHCAGIIAASDNGFGTVGVAPRVELYAVKIMGPQQGASSTNVLRAIDWTIAHRMQVVSMSYGGTSRVRLEEEAYARAAAAGIILVGSAGNEAGPLIYPAAYDSVVSVGALSPTGRMAEWSNLGPQLDLVAPGVDVVSTCRLGGGGLASVGGVTAVPVQNAARGEARGKLVEAGRGLPINFRDFPVGAVALIDVGQIGVDEKVHNAVMAGAAGVVIAGLNAGFPRWAVPETSPIPAVATSHDGGDALRALLGSDVTIRSDSGDYLSYDGTSMAAPHVAGVAALLLSLKPGASRREVIDAILAGARDMDAPGRDDLTGFGAVDAYAAAMRLAPERFVAEPAAPRRRPAGR